MLSTAWSAWPYVPPGLPRLSQTPASAVRVMQPVITLLPPSVFCICICIFYCFPFHRHCQLGNNLQIQMTDISLADKGECLNLLDCLKGYALVPVTLSGKSSYLYRALNIFIGATVCLNYSIACLQPQKP